MLTTREFCLRACLGARTLEAWIEAGWLSPRPNGDGERLSEMDLARARLICELKKDLGVNDEGTPVILDLVDQVHGLQRMLREIAGEILQATGPYRTGKERPLVRRTDLCRPA
jgi:chaperone modulatory protein CbpM